MSTRDQQRAQVLTGWIARATSSTEASELLGLSERQAWRLRARFLAEGPAALVHGNRGRASPRRTPDEVRARVVELASGRYDGANDCHLSELLAQHYDITLGRVTVRRILREAGRQGPRRPARVCRHGANS